MVFLALLPRRPLAAVVQRLLPGAVRADGKHGDDTLEILAFARGTSRRSRIRGEQEKLELMATAAALVLVNRHVEDYFTGLRLSSSRAFPAPLSAARA